MKRKKVQAQRKFAQGVPIPQSTQTTNVEKGNTTMQRDPDIRRNVYHSSTSATGLLDVISFQNLHRHREPIVLLERLRNYPEKLQASTSAGGSQQQNEIRPALKHSMCLRSKKGVKRLNSRNTSILKNKQQSKVSRDSSSESMESSNEDDQPLKFLANNDKNKVVSEKEKRVRFDIDDESAESDAIEPPQKRKRYNQPSADSENNNTRECEPKQATVHIRPHGRTSARNEEFEQEAPSRSARRQRSRSMYRPEDVIEKPRLRSRSCRRLVSEDFSSDSESYVDQEVQTTDCQMMEMVIQPSTSGKKAANNTGTPISDNIIAKATVPPKKRPSNSTPSTSNTEANTNVITKNSKVHSPKKGQHIKSANSAGNTEVGSSHSFEFATPSTSQVQARPLHTNMTSQNTDREFTAPLTTRRSRNFTINRASKTTGDTEAITNNPTTSARQHSDSTDNSANVQNCQIYCPSKNYSTMNEIVYADIKDLVGRCKTCDHCSFVDKVQCVLSLFKIQDCRKMIKSKILEYDDEDGSVLCASGSASRPSNEYTTQKYFLLYEKNADSIVEITRIMLGRQLIKIKMSFIPRTPHIRLTVITVSDSDRILEDIINNVLSKKSHVTVSSSGNRSELFQQRPSTSTANTDRYGSAERCSRRYMPSGRQTDAPTFYPTEQEFTDPIAYFNRILPSAARFGLCKVVAPASFKPKCLMKEDVRFGVTNQYISRLYKRWGPGARELCGIKAHLASQGVIFTRPPLLDGVEVNLPSLYYLVQALGGLTEVIEKKRWTKIAEQMNLIKTPKIEVRLDQIYVKYILPYDTLRVDERDLLMGTVDRYWRRKYNKMLERARKPLQTKIDEIETPTEIQFKDVYVAGALSDSEDCITNGRQMNLLTFKKVANRCKEMFAPGSKYKTHNDIEQIYWKNVLHAQEHICINNASIDTGELGHGFTRDQRDTYGKHPWNLKVLSQNPGNMLRFLGPVLGVTVPTLHLGMVFSTSCWHRDPHSLPWIEYMHSGPGKIWYGIPNEQSANFRRAVESLCPTSCQNKSIWLPSDMTMVPPDLLLENNVSMSRVVQEPGQFIIVFPKAYSSSISTGFTVTESVYFAPFSWLQSIDNVFKEVRDNCEPTMFSLEHLLVSVARDEQAPASILRLVNILLWKIIRDELKNRNALAAYKIPIQSQQRKRTRRRPAGAWNLRDQDECEFCQFTLFLSKVRGLRDERRSLCLKHALQFLHVTRNTRRDLSGVELEIFLSDAELKNLLTKMGF